MKNSRKKGDTTPTHGKRKGDSWQLDKRHLYSGTVNEFADVANSPEDLMGMAISEVLKRQFEMEDCDETAIISLADRKTN